MKTNDIFNFRRFGKYFAADIRTCIANYGISLLAIPTLALIVMEIASGALQMASGDSWEGAIEPTRFSAFIFVAFMILTTMPVKCYGKVTEKKYGSFWLSIPASSLEKTVSMIIMTCIIAPVIAAVLFFCTDSLICAIDSTCGESILSHIRDFAQSFTSGDIKAGYESPTPLFILQFAEQLINPWLYIDDFIGMSLPFLLGAVFFKGNKTAKTIIFMIACGMVISSASMPILRGFGIDIVNSMATEEALEQMFNNSIFQNFAFWDTLTDTIWNIAMISAIYFRIKTLKH